MYSRFYVNFGNGYEPVVRVRLNNGIIVTGKPSSFVQLGRCDGIFQFTYGIMSGKLIEVMIWTKNLVDD